MPEIANDPRTNFFVFVDMFFPNFRTKKQTEGSVTILGVPTQKFTREERQMLNQLKQQAEDVEFEEIQG